MTWYPPEWKIKRFGRVFFALTITHDYVGGFPSETCHNTFKTWFLTWWRKDKKWYKCLYLVEREFNLPAYLFLLHCKCFQLETLDPSQKVILSLEQELVVMWWPARWHSFPADQWDSSIWAPTLASCRWLFQSQNELAAKDRASVDQEGFQHWYITKVGKERIKYAVNAFTSLIVVWK